MCSKIRKCAPLPGQTFAPAHVVRPSREAFLSVPPTSQVSVMGDTGEDLLCCCPQALELPPTGGQAGPIFAVLLHEGKGLSLQASFPLIIACPSAILKWILVPYFVECVLMLLLFTIFYYGICFILF